MRGGELSNRVGPSIVVIFEDLIAKRSEVAPERPRKILSWPRADKTSTGTWATDQTVVGALNRLAYETDVQIEIATFVDELGTITEVLDDARVMYSSLAITHPSHLARSLAYAPHISAVYHPHPEHALTYGPRGRLVTPAKRSMIGRF
ncbi:hypothetical protein AB0G15_05455 [Streptosporangium sp. NPDC023825]|uniref:hypothetical protein n=1 Tax=Streptosporangium sp. NPDC023825 TaxID=3154909 RepID=UPI00344890CC